MTKWMRQNGLYCRKCERWIRVECNSAPSQKLKCIFDHLVTHYETAIFSCELCDVKTRSSWRMKQHKVEMHDIRNHQFYPKELGDHLPQLDLLAAECYDWPHGEQ